MRTVLSLFSLICVLTLAAACGDEPPAPADWEGQEPGECTDGADNDGDGAYDCLDSDCAGSPDCQGDDDDAAPDDDDAGPDDDDVAPDDDDAGPDDDDVAPDDDDAGPDDDDTGPPNNCTDDSFEENDTVGAAVTVSDGFSAALNSCPGDEDWFAVDIPPGYELSCELLFSNAEGDIDAFLYDSSGTLVWNNNTTNSDESLQFEPAAGGGLY
ncbi:MAG: hypothetical protein VX498_04435, partial [Myxococcota bacterium]|nr:hypothetical protein [Myxococcota bacterium]